MVGTWVFLGGNLGLETWRWAEIATGRQPLKQIKPTRLFFFPLLLREWHQPSGPIAKDTRAIGVSAEVDDAEQVESGPKSQKSRKAQSGRVWF